MGRTRRTLLCVAPKAREALGFSSPVEQRGSLGHEYWKNFYAELFRQRGYHVEREAPRLGGRVDVHATKSSETVGIEVETGKSDVVSNVRNCLRSKFGKVIVVATSQEALSKVERELGRAGLLIAGRVNVTLREGDRNNP